MIEKIEKVLLKKEEIQKKVRELGEKISKDYKGTLPHLICILKGASIFHSDLIRSISIPLTIDYLSVSSYGDKTESTGRVHLVKDLDNPIKDRDVIIVEDIIDTGYTIEYLLNLFKLRKPRSIKLCALLSKPSRRKVPVKIDYLGFEIPDAFVIGYGLDFDERYRNSPDISILRLIEE